MTAEDFKHLLATRTAEAIVDEHLLDGDPGPYLEVEALRYLEGRVRTTFGLSHEQPLSTFVVGSAKLGFAMLEKPPQNGSGYKPAYREYEAGISDIDVAVVSPVLYGRIWQDLARYGCNQTRFPWRPKDLGDYMLHGWIRPDKFPVAAPKRCNDWKDLFHEARRSKHFMYKNLRCGIYHSKYFLKIYQMRGVLAAQLAEQ